MPTHHAASRGTAASVCRAIRHLHPLKESPGAAPPWPVDGGEAARLMRAVVVAGAHGTGRTSRHDRGGPVGATAVPGPAHGGGGPRDGDLVSGPAPFAACTSGASRGRTSAEARSAVWSSKRQDRIPALPRRSVAGLVRAGRWPRRSLAPPEYMVKLPDSFSFAEGAALYIDYATAWFALHRALAEPRESFSSKAQPEASDGRPCRWRPPLVCERSPWCRATRRSAWPVTSERTRSSGPMARGCTGSASSRAAAGRHRRSQRPR